MIKGGENMKTLLIYYTDEHGKRRLKRRSSRSERRLRWFLNSFLRHSKASKTDIYLQLDLFEESG